MPEHAIDPHPDYSIALPQWEKADLAFVGDENFKEAYLFQLDAEKSEALVKRRESASYENQYGEVIYRRQGIVLTETIKVRSGENELPFEGDTKYSPIFLDTDLRNTHYRDFRASVFQGAQKYGYLPVLVDKQKADEGATDRGKLPYFKILHPKELWNWAVDVNGLLTWVVLRTSYTEQEDPMSDPVQIVEYRVMTDETITIYVEEEGKDEKGKSTGKKLGPATVITNEAGVIPIAFFYDTMRDDSSLLGKASLDNALDMTIKYFNQDNWYDQGVYKTNYATLALAPYLDPENEDKTMVIGPSTPIFIDPDSTVTPTWVSPGTEVADVFERKLSRMNRSIYEMAQLDAGYVKESRSEVSGEAFRYRRMPTEEMAKRLGKGMENGENRLWRIVTLWEKTDTKDELFVSYPEQYNTASTTEALKDIKEMESLDSIPTRVTQKYSSDLPYTQGFANMGKAEQDILSKAILEYDPTTAALENKRLEAETLPQPANSLVTARF